MANWEKGISGGRYSLALVGLVYNKQGFNKNSSVFRRGACVMMRDMMQPFQQNQAAIVDLNTPDENSEGYLF